MVLDLHPPFPENTEQENIKVKVRRALVYIIFALLVCVVASCGSGGGSDGVTGQEKSGPGETIYPTSPDIDVFPLMYDFQGLELYESRTTSVTVFNEGDGVLMVTEIGFWDDGGDSNDFSITSAPDFPVEIAPLEAVEIEVSYTPSVAEPASAVLEIASNDPDEPTVEVTFSGKGVAMEAPPEQLIVGILEFFVVSADAGELVGSGPGKSALRRLESLRKMIQTAADLIESGLMEEACEQVQDIYSRTDGDPSVPDFVVGDATGELANRLLDLMAIMGCE